MRETLQTSWGTFGYERGGDSLPALVLLHGTGCDSADWNGVLDHLPEEIARVAINFLGHGGSSVPDEDFQFSDLAADINLAMELLAIDRPVTLGHSLGGIVAIELASRRSLEGIVFLEGWTRLSVARNAFVKRQRFGKLTEEQTSLLDQKRERTQARFFGDQLPGFWHTVTEFDGLPILGSIDVPVWEDDGCGQAKDDTKEHFLIPDRPNIRVEWIDGCGHFLYLERPDAVAGIIARASATCR